MREEVGDTHIVPQVHSLLTVQNPLNKTSSECIQNSAKCGANLSLSVLGSTTIAGQAFGNRTQYEGPMYHNFVHTWHCDERKLYAAGRSPAVYLE